MVETELCFLEVQIEGVFGNAFELGESEFGISPEALDAIDVRLFVGKFVSPMLDAQVFGVANIDQAIVAAPAIGMDDALQIDFASNGLLQGLFATIRNDLGVDMGIAFEDSKDNGLAARASATLASNAFGPEVRLVDFDFPPEGVLGFTVLGDALP